MDQGDPALRRGEGGEEADPGFQRSGLHDMRRGAAGVGGRADGAFHVERRVGHHLVVALAHQTLGDERLGRCG